MANIYIHGWLYIILYINETGKLRGHHHRGNHTLELPLAILNASCYVDQTQFNVET